MKMRHVTAAAVLVALAACARQEPRQVGPEEVRRAQEALKPFKGRLLQELVRGLGEGPEAAIRVCRDRAPEIAADLGGEGLLLGRTSHRLRNPANAPEAWMEPLLAAYAAGDEESPYRTVRLPDGRAGYVEPIRIKPLCLQCHGTDISAGVRAELDRLYPRDRATGFEEGAFRGLFWVVLPADR